MLNEDNNTIQLEISTESQAMTQTPNPTEQQNKLLARQSAQTCLI